MYKINLIPNPFALQPCSNEDQFFQAIPKVDLTALVAVIAEATAAASQGRSRTQLAGDDTPVGEAPQSHDEKKPRGRKAIPAEPFVLLRLYCLYPGTGAPPELETLRKNLKKNGGRLAKRFGFTTGGAAWKTIKERFQWLDAHPDLIIEALRAISPRDMQLSMFPTDPVPLPEEKKLRASNCTKETNAALTNSLQDTVGDDEFDEDTPRGSGTDDRLLLLLYGGNLVCHKCVPGTCKKGHDHGLTERPPIELNCPRGAKHKDGKCIHEVRRQWRCRCCGSNLSVTAGIEGLSRSKLPNRVMLRCIHIMLRERDGVAANQMSRGLNFGGRTMRRGTIRNKMRIIREAMKEQHPLPFRGTVEIDEAKVKLKDGYVHLIGAYDHATRRVYIEILDGPANREVMRDFIERVSLPGSRVYTDGTAAWPPGINRIHGVVIHKYFQFGRGAELYGKGKGWFYITTNRIEGKWGRVRRSMRVTTTVTRKYFPMYLDEVMWRINHLSNLLEAESYEGEERRGAARRGADGADRRQHRQPEAEPERTPGGRRDELGRQHHRIGDLARLCGVRLRPAGCVGNAPGRVTSGGTRFACQH